MVRRFFYNYIADDKTKIKTNFPNQHTLLLKPNKSGLNSASDGVQIHFGSTNSLNVTRPSQEYALCIYKYLSSLHDIWKVCMYLRQLPAFDESIKCDILMLKCATLVDSLLLIK